MIWEVELAPTPGYEWKGMLVVAVNPLKSEKFASLHGIRITEKAFEQLISVESPYRYELIDGLVYDMTGSSPEHSVIAGHIDRLFQEQLGGRDCYHPHREQYVAIPDRPPVVPDVVVTCDLR